MRFSHVACGVALMLLPVCPLQAGTRQSRKHTSGTVHTAKEAKAIAERETGGQAVSARRIPLNGASGGWEVEVHMPNEDRGWRCVIDCDTHMVFTKTHIANPAGPGRRTSRRR